jgi:hypothetical protein
MVGDRCVALRAAMTDCMVGARIRHCGILHCGILHCGRIRWSRISAGIGRRRLSRRLHGVMFLARTCTQRDEKTCGERFGDVEHLQSGAPSCEKCTERRDATQCESLCAY